MGLLHSKTGTFTQQDTLDAPLDPANANRYAYAGNDPINNTDPTGRLTDAQGEAASAVVCAGGGLLFGAIAPPAGAVITIGCGIIGVGVALDG